MHIQTCCLEDTKEDMLSVPKSIDTISRFPVISVSITRRHKFEGVEYL